MWFIIDLHPLGQASKDLIELGFDGDYFLKNYNLTNILNVLENPYSYSIFHLEPETSISIQFIVIPSEKNLYYENYLIKIRNKSEFFQNLENNSLFIKLFENTDFCLYQVESSVPS